MSKNKTPHISAVLMVKDEKDRIEYTLKSVLGIIKSVIIYDTGSTDNTIELITNFCNKHSLPLHLKQGIFADFSTSRNVLLDFLDEFTEVDYALLLDVNDELRNGNVLLKFAKDKLSEKGSAYYIYQEWKFGRVDKYLNIRLIKPRKGWRYKAVVHEYIDNDINEEEKKLVGKCPDEVILFQDRIADNNKSGPRFKRDKELLYKEYLKNPNDSRTLFYLAQTCACLEQYDESYYYYKLRSYKDDFMEEKYISYYKLGKFSQILGHDWKDSLGWYMKAFETLKRAEPLCDIADYYFKKKDWISAWMFISMACNLSYPENCLLFVDKWVYDYQRWHLMGIIGFYVQEYKKGKEGCEKAIAYGDNIELNKSNLKFYTDKGY
jgi:hypothetical protein